MVLDGVSSIYGGSPLALLLVLPTYAPGKLRLFLWGRPDLGEPRQCLSRGFLLFLAPRHIPRRTTRDEIVISWRYSHDRSSSPVGAGVVASLSSTDMSVERADRIHGSLLAQPKRERAGSASRPRASGVNARQRHSEDFGTYGPVEARHQAMAINSEETTSVRDGKPRRSPVTGSICL